MIELGKTYQDKYLNTELGYLGSSKFQGLITLKREKKSYGYKIVQGTNYISIYNTKLQIFDDGRAKAVTKVDTNYRSKYQYTLYFDKEGREIKGKSTREEMLYWKKL